MARQGWQLTGAQKTGGPNLPGPPDMGRLICSAPAFWRDGESAKQITRIGKYSGGKTSPRTTTEIIGIGHSDLIDPTGSAK